MQSYLVVKLPVNHLVAASSRAEAGDLHCTRGYIGSLAVSDSLCCRFRTWDCPVRWLWSPLHVFVGGHLEPDCNVACGEGTQISTMPPGMGILRPYILLAGCPALWFSG